MEQVQHIAVARAMNNSSWKEKYSGKKECCNTKAVHDKTAVEKVQI